MPQHLPLPNPHWIRSRRTSRAGGERPKRSPEKHGRHLHDQLTEITRAPHRLDNGIDPSLVFKIKACSRPAKESFEGRGLQTLSESMDYTYFVLTADQGTKLSQAIDQYTSTGKLRSFFDLIDDIEPYGPEDRRGPGVDPSYDAYSGRRVVDVTLWPARTLDESQARVKTVEAILGSGGNILLRSISARRSCLRVSVSSDSLHDLLETSVVEIIRTPPVPYLDFRDWRELSAADLDLHREKSAVVGVLDDSPESSHPLLNGLVLSDESLAPQEYQWQKRGSHGTEVVGRVLYPNLHQELRDLTSVTALGTVRIVRVLEPDPKAHGDATRFPEYALPHEIIEQGIRHLHENHGVRIFNLSVGYDEPYNDLHVGPLTETLDDLIRELDIVIVLPTGNARINPNAHTPSNHHIIDDKPSYFFEADHRLAEPAPAALAITVGSIALSGAPAEIPNRFGWRAAADPDEASPFSRSGPGLGTSSKRMNKPDLIHYGGNTVVNDLGYVVPNDPGASIVSTSYRAGDGRLFAAVNGTSFAAPAVARVAADILYEYPDVSANLIRALLASSAKLPEPAHRMRDAHQRSHVYGYGIPRREQAIASDSKRVTMTYEGHMPVDTVHIHPLPVPEIFRRGSGGQRTITTALAFNPPVHRQRREYLAGSMKLDIYRDISIDELKEILKKQDPDDPNDPINDRRRLKLEPGSNSFINSTLQLRQWTAKRSFVDDDETFFLVVTHKAQTWARDDPQYERQSYALAVTLDDQHLIQADLYQLLKQQVRLPEQVRFPLRS